MPTFVVKRERLLSQVWVEAEDWHQAQIKARALFVSDTETSPLRTARIQPPDDTGDARSEARYDYSDTDAQTEATEAARWGLGGAESDSEATEA